MTTDRNHLDHHRQDRANLEAELRLAGCTDPTRKDCRCPFHDDRSASGSIFQGDDGAWKFHCHTPTCAASGDVFDLQARRQGRPVADVLRDTRQGAMMPAKRPASAPAPSAKANKPKRTWGTVEEMAKGLTRHGYTLSQTYTYGPDRAAPVAVAFRYELKPGCEGKPKTFLQGHRLEDGRWEATGMPAPRPLFRLPEVLADKSTGDPIVICEGEKAALAVCAAGGSGTTNMGGAGAAHLTDWAPLAGASVILWRDNDEDGVKHAKAVLVQLAALNPRPIVRIVEVSDLPPKADAADLPKTQIVARIAAALEGEPYAWPEGVKEPEAVAGWPEPRPLAHRDLPDLRLAEPLAPAWVADMAAETARHVQVDPGAVGMVALGILSGALCRTRFQVETNAGHFQPLAFYAVILASPSERKSGYFRALMAPVLELRNNAVEEFAPALDAWAEAEKRKGRRKPTRRTKYEDAGNGTFKRIVSEPEPDDADDAPVPVERPAHGDGRFLFEDFTEAALAVGLENCAEAGLIATAEGGLLFDNIGGKLSKGSGPGFDGTILLKAYDREFCDIRRITRAPITLKHPFLALATTAQPGPVFEAFKNPAFRNRGLVSRLALALPPSLAGGREAQTERIPQAVANRWAQEIMEEGMRAMKHVSAPQTIRMSNDARAVWVAYFMELEAGQKPGGRFEELGDWTGKHADRVARVAAVCHVAEHGRDAGRHEITGERMAAAVEFGRALVGHAEAVILGRSEAHEVAGKLLEKAKEGKITDGCTARDIAEHRWSGMKDAATVGAGLSVLAEHGWTRRIPQPEGMGRPTVRWEFHPAARKPG